MSKLVKETEAKWKKECESKDVTLNFYRKEVEDNVEMFKHLSNTIDKQNQEAADMRARLEALEEDKKNGWKAEKQQLENESFERGFKFYLIGFLANDPEYSFDRFRQLLIG